MRQVADGFADRRIADWNWDIGPAATRLPSRHAHIPPRGSIASQGFGSRGRPTALAAEPRRSRQMIRVAAAITIPETNAAKQENSTRSFSTPIMAASLDAAHVGVIPRRP